MFKVGDWVSFESYGRVYKGKVLRVMNDYCLIYSEQMAKERLGHNEGQKDQNAYGSWNVYNKNLTKLNNSPIGQIKVVGR